MFSTSFGSVTFTRAKYRIFVSLPFSQNLVPVMESVIAPTTLAVLHQGYFDLFSQLHSVYIFIRD